MKILSRLSLSSARRKGLTLIEILVASVMFAILATSLFVVFNSVLASWRRTQAHLEVYQNARVALDMVTRDLTAAYLNSADTTIRFRGYDTGAKSGWMTNSADDELFFIAALNPSLNDSNALPELCKVGYWRDTSNVLYRVYVYFTGAPTFTFSAADYNNRHKIASNITQLQFEYWDAISAAFVNTWDSGGAQSGRLPGMVRVTITVQEPNSPKTQTFITNVYIPWR